MQDNPDINRSRSSGEPGSLQTVTGRQSRSRSNIVYTKPYRPPKLKQTVSRSPTRSSRTHYTTAEDNFINYHRQKTAITWVRLSEEFGWRWKGRTQGSLQARWAEICKQGPPPVPRDYTIPVGSSTSWHQNFKIADVVGRKLIMRLR